MEESKTGEGAMDTKNPSQPSSEDTKQQPASQTASSADTSTSSENHPSSSPGLKHGHGIGQHWLVPLVSIFILILVFLGTFLFLNNYFQQQVAKNDEAKENIQLAKEKYIVGTDATFPPMEFKDDEGELDGYDIDLTDKLSEELDREFEVQNMQWDNLFTELDKGKITMIISAVTINDERKQKYDFSEPYFNSGQVIITLKENTTIKKPTDLSGKRVGVQEGTTIEQEALKYTAERLVIRYKDYVEAAKALEAKKLDAIITDLPNAKGIVTDHPLLKIASDPFTYEYYGIVFRKGDTATREEVNKALNALQQKGILEDLKQEWFQ